MIRDFLFWHPVIFFIVNFFGIQEPPQSSQYKNISQRTKERKDFDNSIFPFSCCFWGVKKGQFSIAVYLGKLG
jgi:hypothetical protein